ncbi:MAG: SLC13 family permease [Gammaproteobacteria bacterium]|nr:SLC13 family permease [Gammaproteobacteria bacterium]
MNLEQGAILIILATAMFLFLWGRWRYDLVAALALLLGVIVGVVPIDKTFTGFSHPAVITVGAVLVMSRALQNSGVVDVVARFLSLMRRSTTQQVAATCGLTAALSAFMNNIGALALMLPVTIRNARRSKLSPAKILMPVSFASLLGGLVTLVGTPPNIIIATFRASTEGTAFNMFDFTLVGLPVALVGVAFVSLIGWRLIPQKADRDKSEGDRFHIGAYVSEVRLPPDSPLNGAQVRDIEQRCDNELTVMAIIRGERRRLAPRGMERLHGDDILILEGDPEAIKPLLESPGVVHLGASGADPAALHSDEVRLMEVVVIPNATIEGQSMRAMRMHDRYGINLLAMARQGQAPKTRLGSIRFRAGDVLLLQGERDTLYEVLPGLGCLPLAKRSLSIGQRRRILLTPAIVAIAVVAAALGLVPVQIAFFAAVTALIISNALPLREAYRSVEWPVIVLLGSLIPLGEALQATGGTALIANNIINLVGGMPSWAILAVLMVTAMLLSDLIHNTPTAVLMAPVAVTIAHSLQLPPDAFLMAVAIGSASPYLTPIGHQSNTLVMGPGGYGFSDYWRVGLPLDFVILAVAVPMILWVWM